MQKKWAEDDIDTLRNMRSQGATYNEISQLLGRTAASCSAKASREGITAKRQKLQKRWTEEEVESLAAGINEGLTYTQIGLNMGRSNKSCALKAFRLGLSGEPSRPWTEDEDEKFINLYSSGQSLDEIAIKFDRTTKACKSRLTKLRISDFRFWSKEDMDILVYMKDQGLKYGKIAEVLGRAEKSCRAKAIELGITKEVAPANFTKYTAEELIALLLKEPSSSRHPTHVRYNAIRLFGSWFEAQKAAGVSSGGLHLDKETLLYLIFIPSENLYKIGITQRTLKERFGNSIKYKIIDTVRTDLHTALSLEKTVLSIVNKREPIGFTDGKTETFESEAKINKITDILEKEAPCE